MVRTFVKKTVRWLVGRTGVGSKALVTLDLWPYLEDKGWVRSRRERLPVDRDGVDALEKMQTLTPDLILLDVMMPRMSGFEVCRKLKSDPRTREIPIIMVTALNELSDIERGVESGTDDFISKPVNRLELLTRVRSLLRVRHLRNELDRTLAYLNSVEAKPESDAAKQ